ncbi:hypothetical protein MFUM_970103 [Methylacidiphilum fumariolicum SolV]|uniref:Uncharacterized protein n=2 Tax=Candidatus Methylacidiphilum fumarolicum TaxID=591154 RepID=I0K1G3_METFB|nr:conserved protein of unknown function [Candidatus Methylacidiphilum fumarolicum]CCG93332.1 hypothetical protein MFUM_970103 [Methylacidiphilum fumariolicum SolV]
MHSQPIFAEEVWHADRSERQQAVAKDGESDEQVPTHESPALVKRGI